MTITGRTQPSDRPSRGSAPIPLRNDTASDRAVFRPSPLEGPLAYTIRRAQRSTGSQDRQGGRLVIASNRVADPRQDRKAGGLAVAIAETLATHGGLWFGWSGKTAGKDAGCDPQTQTVDGIDLLTVDLTADELDGYYHGFSNQCLWPLLHYRTDLIHFEQHFADAYRAVNDRFAGILARSLEPADTLWVHDFHLIPLGAQLRGRGCDHPMGFFLHIPFPPVEVTATLPGHKRLFETLLAYDVIGFQTENDAACFRNYAERELGARLMPDGRLRAADRDIDVRAFPIGIDADVFEDLAAETGAGKQIAKIKASTGERALIIGVDRLDYSKGLPERLEAYRSLLQDYPQHRNKVMLMQISPLSRQDVDSYAAVREELDRLEGEIHGQFAEIDWTPLRYIRRPVPRPKLAALYRASRVGLVTPLRDGMNLVAKEYVAAQDPDDPGVLILSRFAGAAEAMRDAVLVNPHDVGQMAAALDQALTMPLDERRRRHAALLDVVRTQDVHRWRNDFLAALDEAGKPAPITASPSVSRQPGGVAKSASPLSPPIATHAPSR